VDSVPYPLLYCTVLCICQDVHWVPECLLLQQAVSCAAAPLRTVIVSPPFFVPERCPVAVSAG
jgi:hypothetical protein